MRNSVANVSLTHAQGKARQGNRYCAANIVLNKSDFKDLTESNSLVIRGTLFQTLAADTAKERPPSVSRI